MARRLPRRGSVLPTERLHPGLQLRRRDAGLVLARDNLVPTQPRCPRLARAHRRASYRSGHGARPRSDGNWPGRASAHAVGIRPEPLHGAELVERPTELQRAGVVDRQRVVRLPLVPGGVRGGRAAPLVAGGLDDGLPVICRDARHLCDPRLAEWQPRAHVLCPHHGGVPRWRRALPRLEARGSGARADRGAAGCGDAARRLLHARAS